MDSAEIVAAAMIYFFMVLFRIPYANDKNPLSAGLNICKAGLHVKNRARKTTSRSLDEFHIRITSSNQCNQRFLDFFRNLKITAFDNGFCSFNRYSHCFCRAASGGVGDVPFFLEIQKDFISGVNMICYPYSKGSSRRKNECGQFAKS